MLILKLKLQHTSAYDLKAVIAQKQSSSEWRLVANASPSMNVTNVTEQYYTQIQIEALALVWACEKFSD